jgi:hypothetical protein
MKSAKISSNSTTTTISSSSNAKLPLDWTCVARKRTKQSSVEVIRDNRNFESTALTTNGGGSTNNPDESSKDVIPLTMDDIKEEYSCSCCPSVVADDEEDAEVDKDIEGTNNEGAKDTTTVVVIKQGIGIFCLHDTDTTWFQGYFIPTDYNRSNLKVKPIGILAVQRDVDECIQCADGGYRELDLTVYNSNNTMEPSGSKRKNTSASPPSSTTVPVICTGGDMLRMRTMPKVSPTTTNNNKDESDFKIKFDATTIYTGTKTIPYLKTYFASLVHKQRELLLLQLPMATTEQVVTDMTELDLLPDCAIVCGDMVIRTTTTTTTTTTTFP